MEAVIECRTRLNDKYQLWDINDRTGISEITGHDGKPFIDRLSKSELQLALSLFIDWFNLLGNKTARKKKVC